MITDYLKNKHKNKMYDCKKSPHKILSYIKEKFNLLEIHNPSQRYLRLIEFTKLNFLNLQKHLKVDRSQKFTYDELNVAFYEIMNDIHSSPSYT